ncbi:MAG: EamA family transporter [Candidatus Nanopelagicales bacterium]
MTSSAVILVGRSAAALVFLCLGALSHRMVFDEVDVVSGLIGGALNLAGTFLILKAMKTGKIGIAAGVSTVYTLIPLAYSLSLGEPLSPLAAMGIVAILVGMIAFAVRKATPEPNYGSPGPTIIVSIASAAFWGAGIAVVDVGSSTNLFGTLVVSQLPSIVVTGLVVATQPLFGGLRPGNIAPVAAAGVSLGLGYTALYSAANIGDIGVASAVDSASPVIIALLALIVLGERLTRAETAALLVVAVGTGLVLL